MKKVLIFSTNYFPYIGGAEVAIKEITDHLGDDELSFDMVVPRYSSSNKEVETIGNVTVYRVGFGAVLDKWLIPFTGLRKAVSLHRENEYTHAWVMMASQASIAGARFKKKFPDVRLVLTLQEGDEEEHLKRYVFGSDFLYKYIVRPIYLSVFRVADHITAISHYLRKRAERNSPDTPITIVPNGVDFERFSNASGDGVREKLGIDENATVVVTTSRLVKKNAVGDLIKSAVMLPDITFLVVGDGELRSSLENSAPENVVFAGSVPFEDIPRYLAASDIFCRPSLSEGQGISFLEAMAAGLPVIATPVGGIVDFLEDKVTGVFCNASDPKSIAVAIENLLSDPALKTRVIVNAQEMVITRYNWEIISKEMNRVFVSEYV